ncbi:MAG: nucleotidyltransferase [Bacteroidia bacterium]|nr:nucleotidyltransferase [Bacteroidia bacterium]
MKIIIPMAGRGSRLRPHTLTVPKPLLPVGGKPIVQRLAEDIVGLYQGGVEEIAFIIGRFGEEVEKDLLEVAAKLGAKGRIFYQDTPLGTAHAIYQARECMDGELIIAFADTLFRADFKLDRQADGVIWVRQVNNPEIFGVVTLDEQGTILGMVEKPTEFVSDLAIIGIYYIRNGAGLREEIKYLLDHNITAKGEYQLTDALENMRLKGGILKAGPVNDWMDCGNKDNVLDTNASILGYDHQDRKNLRGANLKLENSIIIEPCFVGDNVSLKNSVIGPNVSLGNNTRVENAVVSESLVQNNSNIQNVVLHRAMIGSNAEIVRSADSFDLGDFSRLK